MAADGLAVMPAILFEAALRGKICQRNAYPRARVVADICSVASLSLNR